MAKMTKNPKKASSFRCQFLPFCGRHVKGQLWVQVLIGLILGVITGILLGPDLNLLPRETAEQISNWLALPGYFFLSVLQMVVIPLIVACIITGIAQNDDPDMIRGLSWRLVAYFLVTACIAMLIAYGMVQLFNPGSYVDTDAALRLVANAPKAEINTALADTQNIPKRLISVIPTNAFAAMATSNMLNVVIFAIFFGFAFAALPKKQSAPALQVVASLQDACMVLVNWVIRLAPLAIYGLIAEAIIRIGISILMGMAMYMVALLVGLLLMLVVYGLMVMFFARRNPFTFYKNIRECMLIAFSTSSSSATMPVTLRMCEENLKIRPTVSRFTIPLGTAINMDGTAMYQAIATFFLAHIFHVDLSLTDILLVLILSISASIGTPGTPGVGIIILATILVTVGIPPEGIALIIGVDRLLDMCRTVVNVTGDITAATLMEHYMPHTPDHQVLTEVS